MIFSWETAFARSLGLLTEAEWARVRATRIGIGGLGGCGSNHLLALARMGFEKFAVADPDVFEIANMNRQAGANMTTLGSRKTDVMQAMVLDINPKADIIIFHDGITKETLEEFVDQTDIGVNAIDFFRVDLYASYHDTYRRQGKYSIVGASPFAFGAALTVIGPETPSFNEVFGIFPEDTKEQMLGKFCATMARSRFASSYLPPGVNEIKNPLEDTDIASNAAALHLCTALTAAEVLFAITGRRQPTLAPRVVELDLLTQQFALEPTV